mgnify:FL=1
MRRLYSSLFCAFIAFAMHAQSMCPVNEFVLDLNVKLGQMIGVGNVPDGGRTIIPITGGTFSGPNISGTIVSGGADYQLYSPAASMSQLNAIYSICTDDSVNIFVNNKGIIAGNYFFASPKFEAPNDSKYAWLNKAIFVCRPVGWGENEIKLRVWKVCDKSESTYAPLAFAGIPQEAYTPVEKAGKIEEFHYKAVVDGDTLVKRAQVYLPYGYDPKNKKIRYNVLYLMHGGGDNSTSFFSSDRSPLPVGLALDHLIAEGKMDPIIVVAPTMYRDDQNIGANSMEDAIHLTRIFNNEMRDYLIPAVETAYNTNLADGSLESIIATRGNRAFGGFSMGALTTWFQLAYGNDCVSKYIPLSGDLWIYDQDGTKQSAEVAAAWLNDKVAASPYANDFHVFGYTGSKDIAGTPETNLFKALKTHAPVFGLDSPQPKASLTVKEGGDHWYGDVNPYLYEALPMLWPKR